jgi:hypothetical protein
LGEEGYYGLIEAEVAMALIASGTFHIGLQLKSGTTRVAHGRTVTDVVPLTVEG